MASSSSSSSSSEPTSSHWLRSLFPPPRTLDPAYYDSSPEKRRAEAKRAAIRGRLKREYLLQLCDPRRKHVIEDRAMTQWAYAKTEVYPNCKMTPRTSFIGIFHYLAPILSVYLLVKKQREHQEKLRREGEYNS